MGALFCLVEANGASVQLVGSTLVTPDPDPAAGFSCMEIYSSDVKQEAKVQQNSLKYMRGSFHLAKKCAEVKMPSKLGVLGRCRFKDSEGNGYRITTWYDEKSDSALAHLKNMCQLQGGTFLK